MRPPLPCLLPGVRPVNRLPGRLAISTVRALSDQRGKPWRTFPTAPNIKATCSSSGLAVRRDVLGADYVDGSLARADDFNAAFQQMTTEIAWGMIWTRPGLPRKTRSMINLTMLVALNRGAELRLHLRAALTNGVTRDEIKEILLQIGAYCGIPAVPGSVQDRHRGVQGSRFRMPSTRTPRGKPQVGFVGVGNMGWPMAACLVRAGFIVHDQRFPPRGRRQLRPADRRRRPRQPARNSPRRRT